MSGPNGPTNTVPTSEMAQQLGATPKTIRRLVRAGRIPAYRLGRELRFVSEEVLAALAEPRAPRSRQHHDSSTRSIP